MNKKIEVKVYIDRCIGTKACIFENPHIFKFADGKVFLHNPEANGVQTLIKDFNDKEIKTLVKAAELCPVNVISIKDLEKNEYLYDTRIKISENIRTITAEYDDLKEFEMDNKGYFLIRINEDNKQIEVAFCPEPNRIYVKIVGTKPLDIYQTIIKERLISRMDHAAYLGRELQKAKIALDNGIKYVQDDELIFEK